MVGSSGDGLYFDLRVDYAARRITVSGEFDIATARCLTTALAKFVRTAVTEITIDIAGVTHMDSAGVAALTRARSAMSVRGVPITLRGGSAALQQLLGQAEQSAVCA